MKNSSNYSGSPEDLARVGQDASKQSTDTFINPGTPEQPLVSEDARKTGVISGAASAKLKEHLVPKG